MTQTAIDPSFFKSASEGIHRVIQNIKTVITIDHHKLEYILASQIAGGHVMLADSHGVGKTSLARALAGSFDWDTAAKTDEGVAVDYFNRIQCTVDLLPQDILGFNRFDMQNNQYSFQRGPIFAHFVLCDEINLLTPKTQGSFFQAMEEQMVSIEGENYHLPTPFFIISTMNLRGAHLFPLPAPQLDRFMLQISMGYPPEDKEIEIIQQHGQTNSWAGFGSVAEVNELLAWMRLVDAVTIHPDVIHYIVALTRKTRTFPGIITGCSPRAGIKMSRLCRALALVRGQNYATIDLVKELLVPALAHRLELEDPSQSPGELLQFIEKEVKA
ncbi:MAG: MoxR family ATPase [Leptospiraceae bacterium]|nr:MoxR family ATPase [Leptospiraceae bacterium]MCB1316593.1 MoxR family ATPase [Leptospiraceae bacterium]MCB1322740.1 MoxR family ATPase [Leptospiraceae bacterium]